MIAVTRLTDADLTDQEKISQNNFQASSLDFINQSTANNLPKSLLFNVAGLVPGGFQVETVRIKRKGNLGFRYQLKPEALAGDAVLCQALQVMILVDWQVKYSGNLLDLSYQANINEQDDYQDLVIVLKLPEASQTLWGKTCGFNFKLATVDQADGSSFSDQEILTNQVSTADHW